MKKNIIMFSIIISIMLSPIIVFGASNTSYMHFTTSTGRVLENGTKMALDEKDHNREDSVKYNKRNYTKSISNQNELNEYYIAPESENMPNLTLPYNEYKTFKIEKDNYYKVGNRYLISLGVLKSHLGMELNLNEDRTLDVLYNNKLIVTIYIGENKYITEEMIISLSTQPILVNGFDLSVPFDFFSNILNTTITRNREGSVIITYNYENLINK